MSKSRLIDARGRGNEDRKRRDNVARIGVKTVRLECGHKLENVQPAVSTPVGKKDLYFCAEGCGLQPGGRPQRAR